MQRDRKAVGQAENLKEEEEEKPEQLDYAELFGHK